MYYILKTLEFTGFYDLIFLAQLFHWASNPRNRKFELEKAAEKRLSDLEIKFLQKDEDYKNEIVLKFGSSLHPVILKSYRENGINSVQFKEQFLEFADEYL